MIKEEFDEEVKRMLDDIEKSFNWKSEFEYEMEHFARDILYLIRNLAEEVYKND